MTDWLHSFVRESNRVEGIQRDPLDSEIRAHADFLAIDSITSPALVAFVRVVAAAPLRNRRGLDVRVGAHLPPRGGPEIEDRLSELLAIAHRGGDAFDVHRAYETLHPFMDGNGRSGRVLWLWMMERDAEVDGTRTPWRDLGFLHWWYYQSLQASR